LSTAIDPTDDEIVYGSSQYLNLDKSTDKAQNFFSISVPGNNASPYTNFAGPFALAPSAPDILYAGRNKVYKSTDGGQNWNVTNGNAVLDGNAVLAIEISDTNPDLVYAATAPVVVPQAGLFKTTNGGASWTNVTAGIPNRYIMDVAIDPASNNTVYAVVSGFGTPHLYRSVNGGSTWNPYGTGLPDVPVNTITIDPLNSSIIYLGNDIGIYVSIDAGLNWQPFSDGLIDGTLVMDISISPSDRKLRLATHGKGIYQRDMLPVTITGTAELNTGSEIEIGPNPAISEIYISVEKNETVNKIVIYDTGGKLVKTISHPSGLTTVKLEGWKKGKYFVVAEGMNQRKIKSFIKL
jgi:hypothetical protein